AATPCRATSGGRSGGNGGGAISFDSAEAAGSRAPDFPGTRLTETSGGAGDLHARRRENGFAAHLETPTRNSVREPRSAVPHRSAGPARGGFAADMFSP